MKVQVKVLRDAMKAINLVVEKRNTLPILSCVLIVAGPSQMTLTATDLDLEMTKVIDMEEPGKNKAAAFCVDAGTLDGIARKLPADGIVSLDVGAKGDRIVTVSCGRSRFKLPILPTDDFPRIAVDGGWPVQYEQSRADMIAMLHHVAFAASSEDVRYYLKGVYLHVPGDGDVMNAAATDGHRLARFRVDAPEGAEELAGIILPTKTVKALDSLLEVEGGAANVAMSDTKFSFEIGATTLTGKAIDGQFPDYTRVIPADHTNAAWFCPHALAQAVDRVLTISTEKTRGIALQFEADRIVLTVRSPENGEASEEVPANLTGEPVRIGFNGRYLLDVLAKLKGMGAEGALVQAMVGDEAAPTLWRQSDDARATYVVMPMRVA